jgi:hypothetical protein
MCLLFREEWDYSLFTDTKSATEATPEGKNTAQQVIPIKLDHGFAAGTISFLHEAIHLLVAHRSISSCCRISERHLASIRCRTRPRTCWLSTSSTGHAP